MSSYILPPSSPSPTNSISHTEVINILYDDDDEISELTDNFQRKLDDYLNFKAQEKDVSDTCVPLREKIKVLKKRIKSISLIDVPKNVERNKSTLPIFIITSQLTKALRGHAIQRSDDLKRSISKTLDICFKTLYCFENLYSKSKFQDLNLYNHKLTEMETDIDFVIPYLPKKEKETRLFLEYSLCTIKSMRKDDSKKSAIILRSSIPSTEEYINKEQLRAQSMLRDIEAMNNSRDRLNAKEAFIRLTINTLEMAVPKRVASDTNTREEKKPLTLPLDERTIDSWKQTAKLFINQYPHEYLDQKTYIYISEILDNESFKVDPEDYLDSLISKRGREASYRLPDDYALNFFRYLLKVVGLR
ncbi:MAG: hypothetical protein AAGG81_09135, partial [Chlamydiota bacterium]